MTDALLVISSAERRGAEVFASELSTALRPHGVAATVVAIAPGPATGHLDVPVLGGGRSSIAGLARLVRRARTSDVVVSNGGTTLVPTAVAAALARRPFVYRNIGDPTVWGAARAANLRIGAPLRRAAGVAALYPTAADEIADRYSVPPASITVIPNAAATDRFPLVDAPRRAAARAALGLADDLHWVAYVGALSEEKRPLLAIEAIAGDARLGLIVAGDGPLREACRAAASATAPDRIHLLGAVEEVAEVYAAADVLVIPSRTEGIPGVAIEAGLSGLPVVAAAVGGMGHVVDDGITGHLVTDPTPATLATALLDAAERRDELGSAAGRRCRDQFSIDVVAARWAELLHRTAGRRRGAGPR